MKKREELEQFIIHSVESLLESTGGVGPDTILVGQGGILNSMLLVGLLVRVEDFCLENNIPFDWTTDSALSERRSRYRDVASLTDYLMALQTGGST